jgi:hypothetical protein
MIIRSLPKVDLALRFQHNVPNSPKDPSQPPGTTCVILEGPKGTKIEDMTIKGEGRSILKGKDNFCKRMGRKHALRSAFRHSNFDYEQRKAIWGEYNTILTPTPTTVANKIAKKVEGDVMTSLLDVLNKRVTQEIG